MEKKFSELTENQGKFREEQLDLNFKLRQNEQELTNQRDNLRKQVEEFEILLTEQKEQLELKTKEAEYKDALLNQLIKQATTDKLRVQEPDEQKANQNKDGQQSHKKPGFLNKFFKIG